MCGIGGIVRLGNRPIRLWQLKHMASELQHRGHDATGFAIMDVDGKIHTWKDALPAWKVVSLPAFEKWAAAALTDRARILLVHTRQYTKGTPAHNENNHPLYASLSGGIIVHNGMVRNDDALFDANKKNPAFKRSCATDSDIFRALLDNYGRVDKGLIKEMRLVDGTAAVAAMHGNSPGKLLLLRDSNPLVLGATPDTLAFASTKEALHKVLKPWITVHNIPMQVHAPKLSFIPMPDEAGWIIGPNGLEEYDDFKCNGKGVGGYVKYGKSTQYHHRQENAKRAATTESRQGYVPAINFGHNGGHNPTTHAKAIERVVVELNAESGSSLNDPQLFEFTICPNQKCAKHVELSEDDRRLKTLALLACKSCGTNLAGAPDAGMAVN